jgi:hypothetical protein
MHQDSERVAVATAGSLHEVSIQLDLWVSRPDGRVISYEYPAAR